MRSDRRRDRRRKFAEGEEKGFGLKNTLYIAGTILALGIIAFFVTVIVYNNSLDKLYSDLETQEIGEVTENTGNENILEEASATLGKTVDEMINETTEISAENEEVQETVVKEDTSNTETVKETNTEEKNEETKRNYVSSACGNDCSTFDISSGIH